MGVDIGIRPELEEPPHEGKGTVIDGIDETWADGRRHRPVWEEGRLRYRRAEGIQVSEAKRSVDPRKPPVVGR